MYVPGRPILQPSMGIGDNLLVIPTRVATVLFRAILRVVQKMSGAGHGRRGAGLGLGRRGVGLGRHGAGLGRRGAGLGHRLWTVLQLFHLFELHCRQLGFTKRPIIVEITG